jgi:hypothetical protein
LDGQESVTLILGAVYEGQAFDNPVRGTSIIMRKDSNSISYQRGRSIIKISTADIADAYDRFSGEECSTIDLKEWRPQVFASKGHS